MNGGLEPAETPGGGLTMILSLPAAETPVRNGQAGSGEADPGRREREALPAAQSLAGLAAPGSTDGDPVAAEPGGTV